MSAGSTKKGSTTDPLDRHFSFAELTGRGTRGKYLERVRGGTNIVRLDPEIAKRFPSEKAVNDALASVLHLASLASPPAPRPRVRRKAPAV